MKTIKITLSIVAAVILLSALCGCNIDTINKNNTYVSSVKQLVDDTVKYTREYKEKKETFNCREAEESKAILSDIDSICDGCRQLLRLQATDEFDTYDETMKTEARLCLEHMSQIKTLTSYAVDTGDDTFYKNDIEELYKNYYESYENLKGCSLEIQTYWRNA